MKHVGAFTGPHLAGEEYELRGVFYAPCVEVDGHRIRQKLDLALWD